MILQESTTLIIVDPQIDFISGSLAVADGAAAMLRLADLIRRERSQIEQIIVTMDQHPADHCSFESQGGSWPPHCIRYTEGAAIYPALFVELEQARQAGIPIHYLEKATSPSMDEYSAFGSYAPPLLQDAAHIAVAGIAGEYCVRQTIADLTDRHGLGRKLHRIEDAIAYIDPSKR